jgi:hypothetical protein
MTTEGGISLRDIVEMEESERLRWYERCISHNEKVQADIEAAKRR